MKREIGSEFWDVPLTGKTTDFFPDNVQWFASGRSALKRIIDELDWAKTIAIPSWCCDSVIKPFMEAGKSICFYPVTISDGICQDIDIDCDVLLLIDYFGFNSIRDISHKCIIRDVTHSVFSGAPGEADYYFGSLRKWCGVWSGGFAWTKDLCRLDPYEHDDEGYYELRKTAMDQKKAFIEFGRNNDAEKEKFLLLFGEAESRLDELGVVAAAKRDIDIVNRIDIGYIKKTRHENASILMKELEECLLFPKMEEDECPLFVPVIVNERDRDPLHRYLVSNNVFCPKHWPISKVHILDEETLKLYKKEISLVCDQRYSSDDMRFIVNVIKEYYKEQRQSEQRI